MALTRYLRIREWSDPLGFRNRTARGAVRHITW